MVEEGEDISAFESFTIDDAGGQKDGPAPSKEKSSESSESGAASPPKSEPAPAPEETGPSGGKLQPALDRIPNATPAAVRLALESGVKIAGIKGTGSGGQVTEADVKKASSAGAAASTGAAAASYVDVPISSIRKTIASRLTESMNQSPHYYVASTVSVTKLLKLRQALNASADGKYKLSVNDFLIKASAVACKKVPAVNSSWRDGFIRQFNNVDVSVSRQAVYTLLSSTLIAYFRLLSPLPLDSSPQLLSLSKDSASSLSLHRSRISESALGMASSSQTNIKAALSPSRTWA